MRIYGQPVECVQRLKYLGVTLEEGLKSWDTHIGETAEKAGRVFDRILRSGRSGNTGLSMQVLRIYYMSIFLGIMSYAAPIWASSGLTAKAKKKLRSTQRNVLLRVKRAYRTCSHAALHVVAGLPPLDLEIARRVDVYHGLDRRSALNRMLSRWQREWALSTKGVRTREYFPSVRKRVGKKGLKFQTDHYVTQVVTGHGNFNSKLHQFGLVHSPL